MTTVISELVYDVTCILDNKTERVHATRMILYRAGSNGKEPSGNLLEHIKHSEAKYEIVEKLMDVGKTEDRIFIQIKCTGLFDKQDWTWNELNELYQDEPEKVEESLRCKRGKIAKRR